MSEEHKSTTIRTAVIGLVGAILTVCGGLAGALIGGIATIYKTEREAQQIAIAAPDDGQSLSVDTRQVFIASSETATHDANDYLVLPDLGMVMAQPAQEWAQGEQTTYGDLFYEQATNLSPLILFSIQVDTAWDRQAVRRLRYEEPVMVQFLEGATENGVTVDITQLANDTVAFYSQMTILVLDKEVAEPYCTLYGLALRWGDLHQGGVNNIVANPDDPYVFEQVSWEISGVRVDGTLADLTLQRWALFAKGLDHFYVVEVQYIPAAGQSVQVWDDLQAYMDAFRVIR